MTDQNKTDNPLSTPPNGGAWSDRRIAGVVGRGHDGLSQRPPAGIAADFVAALSRTAAILVTHLEDSVLALPKLPWIGYRSSWRLTVVVHQCVHDSDGQTT
jgi:hypothetical protein